EEFNERVSAAAFSQLRFEARAFETDHPGSVAPSISEGLKALAAHGFGAQP
ncbi:MAG: hypothetical protein JNK82_40560, partial [Myxococcaceae bacterium]|nr:hypothetical protein [Myxococcaceae bacterium]